MMGPAVGSLDIPITKGTSGIVAYDEGAAGPLAHAPEQPCIRCARCLGACPLSLNPAMLGALAKRGRFESMASDLHLMDCFECGACSFVCPSHIPLVQRFRLAKAAVRKQGART